MEISKKMSIKKEATHKRLYPLAMSTIKASRLLYMYYTAKPLLLSNNFKMKSKIESVFSKKDGKGMEIRIKLNGGKVIVFRYYKRQRFFDMWALRDRIMNGQLLDSRLKHTSMSLGKAMQEVLQYVSDNLAEIKSLSVTGDI